MWMALFIIAALVQIGYWTLAGIGLRRARQHAPAPPVQGGGQPDAHHPTTLPTTTLPPISVVVAARNEADQLPRLLAALAAQDHPTYEVVIVNDGSTDQTGDIIEAWTRDHDYIRGLTVEAPVSPRKKHALTQGIGAVRYPLLAFTDADCEPPPGWLTALARAHAHSETDTVWIGYSPFRPAPGLVNRVARYETFAAGVFTAAATGIGHPYMAVGRNISYPRAVFEQIGGFEHSKQSLSGDDDLFVQEVRRQHAAPVRHLFGAASYVWTESPATWRAWIRQKTRHVSAGRFYAHDTQAHLTLFQASNVLLWLAPAFIGNWGVSLLAAGLLARGVVLTRAASLFGEDDLLPFFPLWEGLYALYHVLLVPFGLRKIPERW